MRKRMLCLAAIAACLGLVLTGCIYFGNIRPIAVFTATPDHGNSPLNVAFDASGSSDTDGLIETYYWNFGDGQTASLTIATTNHVFTVQSVSKVFTVILKVTDNLGGTDTAIGNIAIDP